MQPGIGFRVRGGGRVGMVVMDNGRHKEWVYMLFLIVGLLLIMGKSFAS